MNGGDINISSFILNFIIILIVFLPSSPPDEATIIGVAPPWSCKNLTQVTKEECPPCTLAGAFLVTQGWLNRWTLPSSPWWGAHNIYIYIYNVCVNIHYKFYSYMLTAVTTRLLSLDISTLLISVPWNKINTKNIL